MGCKFRVYADVPVVVRLKSLGKIAVTRLVTEVTSQVYSLRPPGPPRNVFRNAHAPQLSAVA